MTDAVKCSYEILGFVKDDQKSEFYYVLNASPHAVQGKDKNIKKAICTTIKNKGLKTANSIFSNYLTKKENDFIIYRYRGDFEFMYIYKRNNYCPNM